MALKEHYKNVLEGVESATKTHW